MKNENINLNETPADAKPVLAVVRLSMEEILRDAVRRKATYSFQYADYDLNTWTAPVDLTQNRMDKLLDDGSIRKVRLELEM
jgi:hypothetical protein